MARSTKREALQKKIQILTDKIAELEAKKSALFDERALLMNDLENIKKEEEEKAREKEAKELLKLLKKSGKSIDDVKEALSI